MADPVNFIKTTPFLRALPPILIGIVASSLPGLPEWVVWVALGIVYASAWATLRRPGNGWMYASAALVLAAMAMAKSHSTKPVIPEGEKILIQLQITDNPYQRGRWNNTTAEVGYYRRQGDSVWHPASQKIILSVDTCYNISIGEQLICKAYVNPLERTPSGEDSLSGYAKLMHVRGYWGRSYITPGNLVVRSPERDRSPATLAKDMQAAASEHLSRLRMAPDEMSVATTMTAGERRSISPEVRDAYSRTGTSHLLAVSGLHVGIVFGLINLLLYLLPAMRRGHIAKNVLAVAAIWAYAAMTGLSPSAMRAALMFTGAQAALAATRHRNPINILLGTGAVMLMLNPNNLYDVSFQLSFCAVLAILVMYNPVLEKIKTRSKALNVAIGMVAVGFAATVGTWPLVAYYFNNFPLVGLLINPPVIITSHAILLLSIGWIIAPVGFLNGAMGWLIGGIAHVQNNIIEWSATLPAAAFSVNLHGWGVGCIYFAYLAIIIIVSLRDDKTRFSPEEA